MANNRIYLRCKKCGEELFLGKMFGYGYFWEDYHQTPLHVALNRFYDSHALCGENCFTLKYEYTVREAVKQTEIIRCKDCKWRDGNWRRVAVRWLPCMDVKTGGNWFCGSAERRTDDLQ